MPNYPIYHEEPGLLNSGGGSSLQPKPPKPQPKPVKKPQKREQDFIKYEFTLRDQALFAQNIDQYQIVNQLRTSDPQTEQQITIRDVELKQLTTLMKIQLDRYQKLQILNLVSLNINKVTNFPEIKNLEVLNLTHNYMKDNCIEPLFTKMYPNLLELNLRDNKVRCQNTFNFLALLEEDKVIKLQEFDLRQNPICQKQFTFEFIFDKIPSLMIFNGKYKDHKKSRLVKFDEEIEDCLQSESSISFNNPDQEMEERDRSKPPSFWYVQKSKRNLRYMKNVAKQQKLRIKKRKSPYVWDSTLSKLKKQEKRQKLEHLKQQHTPLVFEEDRSSVKQSGKQLDKQTNKQSGYESGKQQGNLQDSYQQGNYLQGNQQEEHQQKSMRSLKSIKSIKSVKSMK